jgi:hypothetical protein
MRKFIPFILVAAGALVACAAQTVPSPTCSWVSVFRQSSGNPVSGATIQLRGISASHREPHGLDFEETSDAKGAFAFYNLPPDTYTLTV